MVKFTGGEPFISKRFKEFLDYAIEKGFAEDIVLHTITNATKFTDDMIDKIKHFKKYNLCLVLMELVKHMNILDIPMSLTNYKAVLKSL